MAKLMDQDAQAIIEAMEARGVIVDSILYDHLVKISDRLQEKD